MKTEHNNIMWHTWEAKSETTNNLLLFNMQKFDNKWAEFVCWSCSRQEELIPFDCLLSILQRNKNDAPSEPFKIHFRPNQQAPFAHHQVKINK